MLEDLAGTIAEFVNGTLGPIADFLEQWVWGWPEQVFRALKHERDQIVYAKDLCTYLRKKIVL